MMMNRPLDPSVFIAPVSLEAHQRAQHLCRHQGDRQKAQQIYLNVLATAAVGFYLRCMGIATDWETSQSADPVLLTAMDTADLEVDGLGKLECRPVLPHQTSMYLPPEVWGDRLGYVAVQFDEDLRSATLLGFVETVSTQKLPLDQLQPLDDLVRHLHQIQQRQTELVQAGERRACLSRWLADRVETGWRSLESLLGSSRPQLAYGFRTHHALSNATVERAKLLDLGLQLDHQSLALLVAIAPTARTDAANKAQEMLDILVQLHPGPGMAQLPPDLQMRLCSESGEVLQDVRSRQHDNYIQLKRFRGVTGERFDIEVSLGGTKIVEKFII
ncbi:MAG: DUF1822 family protein [Elainellaceae cyanobacterium]